MSVQILQGDCIEMLKTLPDASVHCCITSPPYWGLRDYGCAGQFGLEKTPEEYVAKMVETFREVRRVLRDDGTLWLNLGDSYATGAGQGFVPGGGGQGNRAKRDLLGTSWQPNRLKIPGLKAKDLVGIPWRVAFALQADGWYLRQDIIWAKPNPMPESVRDRCTKAHEYVFMLSKKARYYYDAEAIKEPGLNPEDDARRILDRQKVFNKSCPTVERNGLRPRTDKQRGHSRRHAGFNDRWDEMEKAGQCSGERNRRSVWTIATQPFKDAHFATFPPELIKPMVLAGCPEGGMVLDPFAGSGTTGMVAENLGRNSVLIELNPKYIEMIKKRTAQVGMIPEAVAE
jgi:DNA modification methylase